MQGGEREIQEDEEASKGKVPRSSAPSAGPMEGRRDGPELDHSQPTTTMHDLPSTVLQAPVTTAQPPPLPQMGHDDLPPTVEHDPSAVIPQQLPAGASLQPHPLETNGPRLTPVQREEAIAEALRDRPSYERVPQDQVQAWLEQGGDATDLPWDGSICRPLSRTFGSR